MEKFRSGDMALFAYLDDQQLSSLSMRNMPMVLDVTANDIIHVYESLARSDDYLNFL